MDIAIDEVIYFDVITSDPGTGAAIDADSTPTFEVFEEATDTDIGVGGNLTKRTSKTGNYRGSFTMSAANGFEAGKWYNVIASATVDSIAGKCVALRFRGVPAEAIAGKPKVDVDAWLGTAAATPTVAGVPEVDLTHVEGTAHGSTVVRSNIVQISGDAAAADMLEALMDGGLLGQVNDASATTTAFAADGFTEATDDHFNGRLLTFISGALKWQQTAITDYDAAGGAQGDQQFTVAALTEAPAENDFFIIH